MASELGLGIATPEFAGAFLMIAIPLLLFMVVVSFGLIGWMRR